MIMKIGKVYSNRRIFKELQDIEISGQAIGGKHTIKGRYNNEDVVFVMLTEGAWRGGKSLYYKRIK